MTATTEAPAKGGFLDKIETLGNKVPNPTIMFVYLIGFIALLSAALAWANVSVTDELVTQVPKQEWQTINEALGGMVVPWDITTRARGDLAGLHPLRRRGAGALVALL